MTSVPDTSPSTRRSILEPQSWPRLFLCPALLLAAAAVAQLYWVFLSRLTYPLDIEWMEGAMLVHAHRIMHGQALYAPPSVDFVSFLYTPLYPALLAIVGRLTGLSYTLGRVLSVLGTSAALGALVYAAWIRTKDKVGALTAGMAAAAAFAMAFPFCGAWFDLVRNDSLWLGLVAWALVLLCGKRDDFVKTASASALMVAAFFTKQTAAPMALAAAGALLVTGRWRRALLFGLMTAVPSVLLVLLANKITDGWFWIYIYRLHQSHPVFWDRIWPKTPVAILENQWPLWGALIAAFALAGWKRKIDKDMVYWLLMGLAGLAVASVGSATQGAYKNANIPGVFFPAMAAAVAVATVLQLDWEQKGSWIDRLVPLAIVGILAAQAPVRWFDPRPWVPTKQDRRRAVHFIAFLKSLGKDPFVPYHPYYNIIAGGQGHMHIMGVNDAADWAKAITKDPRRDRKIKRHLKTSIYESFRHRRWSAVLHDRTYTYQLPGLSRFYRRTKDLGSYAPKVWTGNKCRPRFLWRPRQPRP